MTTWQFFLSGWDWEPSVIVGCAGLLLAYFAIIRFRVPARAYSFVAGLLVLFVALVSPLDTLGDTYLFSAHMVQHILLILVVPPLLIIGLPRELMQKALRWPAIARMEHILSIPVLAWFVGVGTMWIWHWPPLYNAALASEPIHVTEHLMFLVSSVIFWWPIISPVDELRLAPLSAVVYVFAACAAHTVLAILITFAPIGIYPAYLQPVDAFHILPLLREKWGLTPDVDQQWGGLLMWVPTCTVYLGFILAILARWYRSPEVDATALPVQVPAFVGSSVQRDVTKV